MRLAGGVTGCHARITEWVIELPSAALLGPVGSTFCRRATSWAITYALARTSATAPDLMVPLFEEVLGCDPPVQYRTRATLDVDGIR